MSQAVEKKRQDQCGDPPGKSIKGLGGKRKGQGVGRSEAAGPSGDAVSISCSSSFLVSLGSPVLVLETLPSA